MITVYHYTSFTKIGGILGKWRGEPAGLEPRRSIGLQFPSLDSTRAFFGFLEPRPANWENNSDFPQTWRVLVHDLLVMADGALLVEVKIDPKKDQAFVGERAHLEGALYEGKTNIPQQFSHEDPREATEAFRKSMIPLTEYVKAQQKEKSGYSLPEVVVLNLVSSERISVSEQQPLIEHELERPLSNRDRLIDLIGNGWAHKELTSWRTRYEAKHGPLGISQRSKERL